jgi:hypothetical protein
MAAAALWSTGYGSTSEDKTDFVKMLFAQGATIQAPATPKTCVKSVC